jgi:hypothetical protein
MGTQPLSWRVHRYLMQISVGWHWSPLMHCFIQSLFGMSADADDRIHWTLYWHMQLEIKAYLESVYGLKVERVNTINYLGRKYLVPSHKVRAHRPADKCFAGCYIL